MPFSLHKYIEYAKSTKVPPEFSNTSNNRGKREFRELTPQLVCIDFRKPVNPVFASIDVEAFMKNDEVPFAAPLLWYEAIIDQKIHAFLIDTRSPNFVRVQYFQDKIYGEVSHFFGIWYKFDYQTRLYSTSSTEKQHNIHLKKNIPDKEKSESAKRHMIPVVGFTALMNSPEIILSDPIEIVAPPMEMPMGDEPIKYEKYVYRKVELRTIKIPDTKIIASEPVAHQQYDPENASYHVRYHWTRGHYRYLSDGRKVTVKGYWSGNVGLGEIKHDYDCTDLVAQRPKRDLFNDGKLVWTKPRVFQDLFA